MKYIAFGILLMAWLNLSAQKEDFRKIFQQGLSYSQSGQHQKAYNTFKVVWEHDSTSIMLTEYYASSAYLSRHFDVSIRLYNQLLIDGKKSNTILYYRRLGEAYMQTERYQMALDTYTKMYTYLSDHEPDTLKKAQEECLQAIESCEFALEQSMQQGITVTPLPEPINTVYSEFNPVPVSGDRLYYSSYYPVFRDSFSSLFSDLYISEIFLSKYKPQGWVVEEKLNRRVNNRKDHNANLTISRNGQFIYFSRCDDIEGVPGNCRIFVAEKDGDNWVKVKPLNKEVNAPESSNTHPYFVESRSYKVLYFVSDRKGGFGGQDIWYSIFKDGKFHPAQNLGSTINTPGNELTPSYDLNKETLYFSSDYHTGFGGFDVFSCKGSLSAWEKVMNMGLPVNSPNNDLYFVPKGYNEGYLSSNRKGSMYSPGKEYCCNDIYHVVFAKQDDEPEVQLPDNLASHDTVYVSTEQQIQDLLPISLYFHNDIPDPGTTRTYTDKNYEDLLAAYILMKEDYAQAYSEGLEGKDAEKAKQDIEDFFQDYVENGFQELNKLTTLLLEELAQGKHVRIIVRGYASPLNNADYNYNLSKRRIASLVNYLKTYDEGIFIPYLDENAKNGGSLHVYEDPQGDRQAGVEVSDNPNDKRNSVYSRSAALERRIQIVRYQSNDTTDDQAHYPILLLGNDSLVIDSIQSGQNKSFIISIQNAGESELQLNSVRTSHSAIRVQAEKSALKPGEKSQLYLLVRGKEIPGDGHYSFTIKSNALIQEKQLNIIIKKKY